MRTTILFVLVGVWSFTLAGCGSEAQTSSHRKVLPLSHGMLVSFHMSGGIAGFNDTVQVSGNWHLIATGRGKNWIRSLSAEEQKQVREILQRFETLNVSHSDGPNVADGMFTSLVARGSGKGTATEEDGKALRELLENLVAEEAN